ncbi:MAG: hypothetical protein EHM89_12315 [Acidobacteria bacterium]|nr:MAG: hypothetical protein EHM89_12315 [Acidobacteriota bacterium]
MRSVALFAAAILLSTGSATHAQNAVKPGYYVQGEMVLTAQPGGELKGHYRISPPFGAGTRLGLRASGGYFITPTLAIEGGVLFAGEISTEQTFSYMDDNDHYTSTFSVVSMNALVRYKPGGWSPVELVIGGGFAAARLAQHDGVRRSLFYKTQAPLSDSSSTEVAPNVTGGADLVLPTRSRAAVVGSFRLRWRGGVYSDDAHGTPTFAVDMGVGLRVRF